MVVNAILSLLRTGCAWPQLPLEFPPWQTVYGYLRSWRADGTVDRLHDLLRDRLHAAEGHDEPPSAAILDAQSVHGGSTAGAQMRGSDAGKNVNGRTRHVVVDTLGLLLVVLLAAANWPDRDGVTFALHELAGKLPGVRLVWADGGCAGKLEQWVKTTLGTVWEIVNKHKG